jgi:hypothetical protein
MPATVDLAIIINPKKPIVESQSQQRLCYNKAVLTTGMARTTTKEAPWFVSSAPIKSAAPPDHSPIRLTVIVSQRIVVYAALCALLCIYIDNEIYFLPPVLTDQRQAGVGSKAIEFVIPETANLTYPFLFDQPRMTVAEKIRSDYNQNASSSPSAYDPLKSCPVTTQVRVIQQSPRWILQSVDRD